MDGGALRASADHGRARQRGTFTDVDGNEYVDFNLADTSMFTGYGIEAFARAVGERAAAGPQFLLPGEDAATVAEELARRFGLPHWQFTLSATQANTEAIRVARAMTGRTTVLMFDGKYHGHADELLGQMTTAGGARGPRPAARHDSPRTRCPVQRSRGGRARACRRRGGLRDRRGGDHEPRRDPAGGRFPSGPAPARLRRGGGAGARRDPHPGRGPGRADRPLGPRAGHPGHGQVDLRRRPTRRLRHDRADRPGARGRDIRLGRGSRDRRHAVRQRPVAGGGPRDARPRCSPSPRTSTRRRWAPGSPTASRAWRRPTGSHWRAHRLFNRSGYTHAPGAARATPSRPRPASTSSCTTCSASTWPTGAFGRRSTRPARRAGSRRPSHTSIATSRCLARLPRRGSEQRRGERPVVVQRLVAVADGLQADVVGAGIEVRLHRLGDRFGRAVRDHGVDQPVAAAVGQVLLGVAEAPQVAGVVGQP